MGYKPFSNCELQDWQNFNCNQCARQGGCRLIEEVEDNNVDPFTWEQIGGADAHRKEIDPTIWRCNNFTQSVRSRNDQINANKNQMEIL